MHDTVARLGEKRGVPVRYQVRTYSTSIAVKYGTTYDYGKSRLSTTVPCAHTASGSTARTVIIYVSVRAHIDHYGPKNHIGTLEYTNCTSLFCVVLMYLHKQPLVRGT